VRKAVEQIARSQCRESFRGRVARSVDTLLEWAAEDVDRTMLFAAQLEIVVPPGSTGRPVEGLR
jgi:hypothetical protein